MDENLLLAQTISLAEQSFGPEQLEALNEVGLDSETLDQGGGQLLEDPAENVA